MTERENLNRIRKSIIGAAIEVHRALGPGLLESAYQACLAFERAERGLKVERQKPLLMIHREVTLDCGYRLDILVEQAVIVEVKAADRLSPYEHCGPLARAGGIGLVNLTTLTWATNMVLGHWLRDDIGPLTLAAARFLTASLLFAVLLQRQPSEERRLGQDRWLLLGMALTGVAIFPATLYLGLRFTTAVNATLINGLAPLITGVLAALLIREPMSGRQVVGAVVERWRLSFGTQRRDGVLQHPAALRCFAGIPVPERAYRAAPSAGRSVDHRWGPVGRTGAMRQHVGGLPVR